MDDKTLIPLCRFRWAVPSFSAYALQPQCRRLQQAFNTPGGKLVWRDVPMVEEVGEKTDG